MATSKTNAHDFIQETFAPLIAVATSPGVEEICKKNNLEFVTLIKPFSKPTIEGSIKDPSGAPVVIHPRVCFCDINARPPPLNVARSYFNEALSSHVYERTTPFKTGNTSIEIPHSTPWFDAWRNTYLQVQYPSDHEFTKHYVGCLITVSSLDQSPVEQLAQITQDVTDMLSQNNNKLPKWFGPLPSILITYGFIHDNSVSHSSLSVPAFEAMKATYGSQKCFFLSVNSQDPRNLALHVPDPWLPHINSMISFKENQQEADTPMEVESALEAGEKLNASTPVIVHPLSPVSEDPTMLSPSEDSIYGDKKIVNHGMMLSSEDLDKIVQFVNDFCTKALVPHFEQQIASLTEQVSNKKGVSRSLFSATKRLFGTNKPGMPGNQISPTAIAYSSDSHELQLRKLGDLCFMIGLYTAAYNAYHSAKRDFYSDGAWLHYAGALEMASLAAFMTDNTQLVKKMIEYSDESISTYQTSCKKYNPFATRATLLSSECLKGKGLYGEAAKQLIRMSGEDSDLRSAVLLEQAAYCFLHSARPIMFRKYAFHMVLAGNRYFKASHKNHSMRCYYQAYQVYESKDWSIAEDHILFTIGKHASQLKLTYNGYEALSALVKRSSRQIPNQQALYFKDYLQSVKNMTAEGDNGVFSIPVADGKLIQVLLDVSSDDVETSDRIAASGIAYNKSLVGNYLEDPIWAKLEEKLVNFTHSSNVLVFTPSVGVLNDRTRNNSPAVIVKGEPVGIRIFLWNPLHIPVTMYDVSLLWSHISDGTVDNAAAISSCLPEVTLQPDSSRYIVLMFTPFCVGSLQVTAFKYTLQESGNAVEGLQHLIPVPHSRISYNSHESDQRLSFTVIGEAPLLHVSFSGLKTEFFCGEVIPVTIHVRNNGSLPISQIVLTCSQNFELYIENCKSDNDSLVFDLGVSLLPNESRDIPAKIHPSWLVSSGTHTLNMLFYYTVGNPAYRPRYRLVRHSWPTEILLAYNMDVSVKKCKNSQVDNMSLNIAIGIQSTALSDSQWEHMELYSIGLYSQMWRLSSTFFLPQDCTIKNAEDIFILIGADKIRQPALCTSRIDLTAQGIENEPEGFVPRLNKSLNLDNEMLLIVSWRYQNFQKSTTGRIYGQSYCKISVCDENSIPRQRISPETLKPSVVACIDKPIDFWLYHDSFVEKKTPCNDSKRSVMLGVTLKLLNRLSQPLSVKIIADCSQLKSSPSMCSFCWCWQGKGLFEYKLEPYQEESLYLEAEFYRKGVYNLLAGIEVMAKINDEFIVQNDPTLSSVIVIK